VGTIHFRGKGRRYEKLDVLGLRGIDLVCTYNASPMWQTTNKGLTELVKEIILLMLGGKGTLSMRVDTKENHVRNWTLNLT